MAFKFKLYVMELTGGLQLVVIFGSLILSAVLHEVMHGMTALYLGDDTAKLMGRLTLNPIKHIDPFTTILLPLLLVLSGLPPLAAAKPVPFNPNNLDYDEYGEALVGIAGPLTNLALAIVSGLWIRFVIGIESGVAYEIMFTFMIVNLSLFVFNLIPFPPLDGSRILYAFAPETVQDFMRSIEKFGIMGIVIFYLLVFRFLAPIIVFIIAALASLILGINVAV